MPLSWDAQRHVAGMEMSRIAIEKADVGSSPWLARHVVGDARFARCEMARRQRREALACPPHGERSETPVVAIPTAIRRAAIISAQAGSIRFRRRSA